MNKRTQIPKKVAIIGAARSGIAAAKLLLNDGAEIFISDSRGQAEIEACLAENNLTNIAYEYGAHSSRILQYDLIVLSPGVPSDIPIVMAAKQKGIPVWSEVELAFRMCDLPFIAVTGSSGKSTTVSMIGAAFAASKKNGIVAGNIGIAVSSCIPLLKPHTYVIAEVSSFQLENVDMFHPNVAVVTNFLKNHLDRYKSEEHYYEAKKNIAKNHGHNDLLVLNMHDRRHIAWAKELNGRTNIAWFGCEPKGDFCVWLDNSEIKYRWGNISGRLFEIGSMKLAGKHNYMNACAASAACLGSGLPPEAIVSGIVGFKGLEHRLEFVAECEGVRYYNDSKSTTAESVLYAVSAFGKNVHLIAGGKDKGCDFSIVNEAIAVHVKDICLIGEAAERMKKQWEKIVPVEIAKTLEEALERVRKKSSPADVVVFSPGCSSFDMFKDYEHRGAIFKQLVLKIKDETKISS